MPEAWIVPAAEEELRSADEGSQRAILGAIQSLESHPMAGRPYGGDDNSAARYFVVDNWWVAYVVTPPTLGDRVYVLQIAVPGARSRDECFEEALSRLNAMPEDHPGAPALAQVLTHLSGGEREIIRIKTD